MDANNACINYSGYFEEGIPDPTYSNVLDISSVMFTFGNIDAPNAVSLSGPAFATPVQFTNISLIVGSAGTLSCALSETHWHIDSSYNGYIQSDPFSINLPPDTRIISFHDMHFLETMGSQVYLHAEGDPFEWYLQSENSGYLNSDYPHFCTITYNGYFSFIADPSQNNTLSLHLDNTECYINNPSAGYITESTFASPVYFTNFLSVVSDALNSTLRSSISDCTWSIMDGIPGYIRTSMGHSTLPPEQILIQHSGFNSLQPDSDFNNILELFIGDTQCTIENPAAGSITGSMLAGPAVSFTNFNFISCTSAASNTLISSIADCIWHIDNSGTGYIIASPGHPTLPPSQSIITHEGFLYLQAGSSPLDHLETMGFPVRMVMQSTSSGFIADRVFADTPLVYFSNFEDVTTDFFGDNILEVVSGDIDWRILCEDQGYLEIMGSGTPFMNFNNFGSLKGSSGDDMFIMDFTAALSGSIDGGAGHNLFDYSTYGAPYTIDLNNGTATGISGSITNIFGYEIATTWSPNGSGTPNNPKVYEGFNQTIQLTADEFYHVEDVTANGVSVGALSEYTFIAVDSNQSLYALFTENIVTNNTPEWWLRDYYPDTNDLANAALSDTDTDEMSAWEEYIAGCDPTDSNDFFKTSLPATPTQDNFVMQWNSLSGRVYSIYYTTNLLSGLSLLSSASNLPATPPLNVYTDETHTAETHGFYRLEVELAPGE